MKYYQVTITILLISLIYLTSRIRSEDNIEELRKTSIQENISKRSLKITIPNDYNDFVELLKPILIKRVSGTPGNVKVRNYIKSQMESYGWLVDAQEFQDNTPYGTIDFVNLIATLPIGQKFEANKRNTRNRIVFACHYDSKYFDSINFVAATDSAVPCAMLIDIAKYFHENIDPKQFNNIRRNIQFMFFDGEEAFVQWTSTDSTYGSRGLARYLSQNYGRSAFQSIDMLVLLDLIGAKTCKFPNYFPSSTGGAYNKLMNIESNLVSRGLLSKRQNYFFTDTSLQNKAMVEDDHLPFMRKGVPILHLIPSPFPAQWHQASDNFANLDKNNIQDLRLIFKLFFLDLLNVDVNKLF